MHNGGGALHTKGAGNAKALSPWARNKLNVLEVQKESQCGYKRVEKGKTEGCEVQEEAGSQIK